MPNFIDYSAGMQPMFPGQSTGVLPVGSGNSILDMLLPSLLSRYGLQMGQFSPSANVQDVLEENRRREQMDRAAAAGAQHDVQSWLQMTRGALRSAALPYGLDQQAAFQRTYQSMAPIMPMLATVAPDIIDQLHGSRGSATVLASNLLLGGQYRSDVMGQYADADYAGRLAGTIQSRLYGTEQDIAGMRGIGMGQLGSLFREGVLRGFMPASMATMSAQRALSVTSAETGMTTADLQQLDAGGLAEQFERADMSRITTKLKSLAHSVSAMRDLFGSQGISNAPMTQILNAMEAITQSRMGSMSGGEVAALIRRTQSTLEVTGMTLDGFMSLAARAGESARGLGLDSSFGVSVAQSSAVFGAAYRQAFGGDYTAFGAMPVAEAVAKDLQLTAQAAGSEQVRLGGAVIRTVEMLGVGADSRAGRLAAALRRGDTEFEGQAMYDVLKKDKLSAMMAESGVDALGQRAFAAAAEDRFGNQEYIQKYGLTELGRRGLQSQELVQMMGLPAGSMALTPALTELFGDEQKAIDMSRQLGPKLLQSLLDTDDVVGLSSAKGRQKLIQEALAETLGDDAAASIAPEVALSFESTMNRMAKQRGYEDLGKMLQLHNKTISAEQGRLRRVTSARADLKEIMSPLGRANVVQRVMDMLRQGDGEEDILRRAGRAMGMLDVGDIDQLRKMQDEFMSLSGQSELSEQDVQRLEVVRQSIQDHVDKLVAVGAQSGADIGRTADSDLATKSARQGDLVAAVLADESLSPEDRLSKLSHHVSSQLSQGHELIQELYLDKSSLRRLGVGATDQVQKAEDTYLEMMRLAGGDADNLAKILSGAAGTDAETVERMRQLQSRFVSQMSEIHAELATPPSMTDEEFAVEEKALEEIVSGRMADEDTQITSMTDRLSQLAAEDPSQADAELKKLLGEQGSYRRKSLESALAARSRLEKAAEEAGVSVDQLRGDEYAEDIMKSGSLLGLDRDDDLSDVKQALREFEPDKMKQPSQQLELTGTLHLVGEDTGELKAAAAVK